MCDEYTSHEAERKGEATTAPAHVLEKNSDEDLSDFECLGTSDKICYWQLASAETNDKSVGCENQSRTDLKKEGSSGDTDEPPSPPAIAAIIAGGWATIAAARRTLGRSAARRRALTAGLRPRAAAPTPSFRCDVCTRPILDAADVAPDGALVCDECVACICPWCRTFGAPGRPCRECSVEVAHA